jgi:hypothetical protein
MSKGCNLSLYSASSQCIRLIAREKAVGSFGNIVFGWVKECRIIQRAISDRDEEAGKRCVMCR